MVVTDQVVEPMVDVEVAKALPPAPRARPAGPSRGMRWIPRRATRGPAESGSQAGPARRSLGVRARHRMLDVLVRTLPLASLLAVVGGALLTVGVPAEVIGRYGLYLALDIAVPGCLVAGALLPRRSRAVEVLVVGIPVGYALELGGWARAMSGGGPDLAALTRQPRTIAGAALAVIAIKWLVPHASRLVRRIGPVARALGPQRQLPVRPPLPRWWGWAVAACSLCSFGTVAIMLYPANPWPAPDGGSWTIDLLQQLGWAGDAQTHLPPVNPSVSGVPQAYHWFLYAHMAASHELSGVPLPWLVFRLAVVPMLLVVPALLAVAATRLSSLPWAGPIAALVGTVGCELDLTATKTHIAFGGWAYYGGYSPTYLFGLVFAAGLLALITGQLAATRLTVGWVMRWALVAGLVVAGSGAKATVPPLIVGGLAFAAVTLSVTSVAHGVRRWFRVRRLRADPRPMPWPLPTPSGPGQPGWLRIVAVFTGLAVTATVFWQAQTALYGAEGSKRLILRPLALIHASTPFAEFIRAMNPEEGQTGAATTLGTLVVLALLTAPVSGAFALIRSRNHRAAQLFLLGTALTGLVIAIALQDPANSQHWFLVMGLPAAGILGGWGAAVLIERTAQRRRGWLAAVAAAVGLALAVSIALIGGGGASAIPSGTEFFMLYGVFMIGLVVVALTGLLTKSTAALVVAMLIGGAAANVPLTVVYPMGQMSLDVQPRLEGPARSRPDASADVLNALTWIRTNTDPDDVIAVNNHCLITNEPPVVPYCADPRVFVYSAFSERRYLVESWSYTEQVYTEALTTGREYLYVQNPFDDRTKLNDLVFRYPNQDRLSTLYQTWGVRYLLADTRPPYDGGERAELAPELALFAEVVYRTEDAVVYRIAAPPLGQSARGQTR